MTCCHRKCLFVFMAIFFLSSLGAAQDLTVVTGATSYNLGETVEITIHNPTDHTVEINSYPYLGIVHEETQSCVYGCVGLPVMESISAGETVVIQYDTSTNTDPAGSYQIVVYEFQAGTFPPPPLPTTEYTLIDPTGNEDKQWSSLKTLYR
ncbi:hypothetical protein H8E07_03990 [bacterium]|nr:hypothetical protein [bacterium]